MQEREASLDAKFDHKAEAERLLVWAKRATQVCSAWKLNQLAEHCALFMDMEAFEQGDRTGEHLQAFRSDQAGARGGGQSHRCKLNSGFFNRPSRGVADSPQPECGPCAVRKNGRPQPLGFITFQ